MMYLLLRVALLLVSIAVVRPLDRVRPSERVGRNYVTRHINTPDGPVAVIVAAQRQERNRNLNRVPQPVQVSSSMTVVKGATKNGKPAKKWRKGRNMAYKQRVRLGHDGIPIIEGVREPDDPSDTRVFRNARVINNVLITTDEEAKVELAKIKEPVPLHLAVDPVKARGSQGRRFNGRIMNSPLEEQGWQRVPRSRDSSKSSVASFNYNKDNPNVRSYSAYQRFYDPHRTGMIQQPAFPPKKNERLVSFSYNTGNAKPKPANRDVVYGSGFAAPLPKSQSHHQQSFVRPQVTSPQIISASQQSQIQKKRSFVPPPHITTGFLPSVQPASYEIDRAFQEQPKPFTFSIKDNPQSSKIKFPESPSSNPIQKISTGYSNSQILYKPPTAAPVQPTPSHPPPPPPQPSANPQNFQFRPAPHNAAPHVAPPHFLPQNIPTPQKAFSQASHMIHPGIVPTNANNFVIEKQTFQSHPGAPTFSVPVPRPIEQVQNNAVQQYQPQKQQQQHHQQPAYFAYPEEYQTYPQYGYQQQKRPLIDRMMDPLRRVGSKVYELASPVLNPMIDAGQRLGYRWRIPERMDKISEGTFDTDAVPIFAGAVAIATLGALGAYAANNNFAAIPLPGKRSIDTSVSDVLLKLSESLDSEDPSFVRTFVSSSDWLESECAKKVVCALITASMVEDNKGKVSGRDAYEDDLTYLEEQMNVFINKISTSEGRSSNLRASANDVMNGVKARNCSAFQCRKSKQ